METYKLPSPAVIVSTIDLRGTGFKIHSKERWILTGYHPQGALAIDNNRQTASFQVFGNIGFYCPLDFPEIKLAYCGSNCGT